MSAAPAASPRPRAMLVALAALFATLVLAQGISAPFQKDAEPQSAEWMQSVARGHLLAPRDYYGYLLRKPLLYYWAGAVLTDLTGGAVDEVRARLVAVASAIALCVLMLVWTCANVGAIEGWLTFVFMLGMYGFAARAPLALTDMTLTLIVIAALAVLYPLVETEIPADARDHARRIGAAIALLFLGVLTKGPVAIVLPALAIAIYLLLERRNPLTILRARWVWIVVAPVLLLSAAWYAVWFRFGDARMAHMFVTENFGHFLPAGAGGTGEGARPPWFIVARMIGGSMPLVLMLPVAIAALVRGRIAESKRAPIVFQASLALAVIVFFSIASAKRDDYILPALPGIAVLSASAFGAREDGWRGLVTAAIALAMLAAAGLVGVAAIGGLPHRAHFNSSDSELIGILLDGVRSGSAAFVAFGFAIVAAALATLAAVWRRRIVFSGAALGALSLVASLLFTAQVRPALAERRSVRTFAPMVRARVGAARICIVSGLDYELSFYYGAAVPDLKTGRCADAAAGAPAYLFAYAKEFDALAPAMRARLTPVLQSNLLGGPGPPALYEIAPASNANGLKAGGEADK